MNKRTITSDTCQLQCVDNDRSIVADVLSFKEGKYLSVSVMRSVKLEMKYNERTLIYEGNMGGLTFTTAGPIITNVKQGR